MEEPTAKVVSVGVDSGGVVHGATCTFQAFGGQRRLSYHERVPPALSCCGRPNSNKPQSLMYKRYYKVGREATDELESTRAGSESTRLTLGDSQVCFFGWY